MLFSVILTTYERPSYLREALHSVLQQSIPDFECLIIDDASTSPLPPFTDPRVRVIRRSRNGGPAEARNTGIEAARGEYVTFLDDDDLYSPDRLAIALEGLEDAPLALCWSSALGKTPSRQRELNGNIHDIVLNHTTPHLGTVSIARDVLTPFNAEYLACEDLEWWLRSSLFCNVRTVPRVGYYVRPHAGPRAAHGTSARIQFSARLLQEYVRYFETHRQAAAFRWKRIGLMHLDKSEVRSARAALLESLKCRPSASAIWHLARAGTRWG